MDCRPEGTQLLVGLQWYSHINGGINMKKSRIFFSALLILTLLAAPACADMFYLCENDGITKVAAFTAPNLVWGEYPQDLAFAKSENGGVGLSSIACSDTDWMLASVFNKTDNKQYVYAYPYHYKGWGELIPQNMRFELADCKMLNPRGTVQLNSLLYMIDRGDSDTDNGSITLCGIDYNGETGLPYIKKLSSLSFKALAEDGNTMHPEAVFATTVSDKTELFVLLSVWSNTFEPKNNILVRIETSEDYTMKAAQSKQLETKGFDGLSHKPCITTVESIPYLFLACGDIVEQVNLSGWDSNVLYSNGSGESDWNTYNFEFKDIVLDSENAYAVAQGKNDADPDEKPFYIRLYTVKAADFLDVTTDPSEKTMKEPLSLADSEFHPTSAFADSYLGRIYLFLGNNIYLYNKKYSEGALGGKFVNAVPCKPYIAQPTSADYGSGGSGCNAGCSAAMLLFCAAPLFFRKKR